MPRNLNVPHFFYPRMAPASQTCPNGAFGWVKTHLPPRGWHVDECPNGAFRGVKTHLSLFGWRLIHLQHTYSFFIVPCYYNINLGCFIHTYKRLYIVFWTNLSYILKKFIPTNSIILTCNLSTSSRMPHTSPSIIFHMQPSHLAACAASVTRSMNDYLQQTTEESSFRLQLLYKVVVLYDVYGLVNFFFTSHGLAVGYIPCSFFCETL